MVPVLINNSGMLTHRIVQTVWLVAKPVPGQLVVQLAKINPNAIMDNSTTILLISAQIVLPIANPARVTPHVMFVSMAIR